MVCILSLPLIPLGVFRAKKGLSYPISDLATSFVIEFGPVVFFTLAIGLTIACTYLIVMMKKYLHKSFKSEVCRIQTIFLVFTVSYLTRAVIYYVLDLPNVHPNLTDFAYDYTIMVGFNFWDVIPLTLVMVFHLKKIKPVEDDTNDSLLDDQSSLSARSMNLLDSGILQSDPEFAEILIMNRNLSGSSMVENESQTRRSQSKRNTDECGDQTNSQQDEPLSSSGDEISVPSRSLETTLGESSGEEGVDKITYPYVES